MPPKEAPRFELPDFDPTQDRSQAVKSGKNAAASGRAFQDEIDRSNVWYRKQGLAVITEIPVPTRHVRGGNGRLRELIESDGPPDYIGSLTGVENDTYPFAMDAKVTTGHTTFGPAYFPNQKGRATLAKQAQWLLDFWETGGVSGLLCLDRGIGAHGAVFWIPAPQLKPFTSVAFLARLDKPAIPIRDMQGKYLRPHVHMQLLNIKDPGVINGASPLVDYRSLILSSL